MQSAECRVQSAGVQSVTDRIHNTVRVTGFLGKLTAVCLANKSMSMECCEGSLCTQKQLGVVGAFTCQLLG